MKCFCCRAEISDRAHSHVYACAKLIGYSDKSDIRYKQLCFKHGLIFDEPFVRTHYLDFEWSLPDFFEHFGLAFTETSFLLDFFNIPTRSITEAKLLSRYKKKVEATCTDRYGFTNPSSNAVVKSRRIETVSARYGVDNVRKSVWFKQHQAETMQARYGVGSLPNRHGRMQDYWDGRSLEEKQAHMRPANVAYKAWYEALTPAQRDALNQSKATVMHSAGSSNLEARVAAALQELNLACMQQCWVNRRSYDFLLNGTKLLIEVQGDYWHANPEIYHPDDIIRYPNRVISASMRRAEDLAKRLNAESYGFRVLELWESDIKRHAANLPEWLNLRIEQYIEQFKKGLA